MMIRRMGFGLAAMLTASTVVGAAGDDSYAQMERFFAARESRTQRLEGGTVVTGDAPMTGVVPAEGVRFVVGESKDSKFEIVWDSGKVTKLPIAVRDAGYGKYIGERPERKKAGKFVISNATVTVGAAQQRVRPELNCYAGSAFNAYWGRSGLSPHYYDMYLDFCESLPKASDHVCDIRFAPVARGVRVWLDGSYQLTVGPAKGDEAARSVKEIRYSFAKGATFALKGTEKAAYDRDRFTVLDFAANPRAKAFAKAELAGGGGHSVTALPGDVPISICRPIDSGDVAICHETAGYSGMSWNPYTGRAPMLGYSAAVHYRVLAKPYVKAHVVFALDDEKSVYTKKAKDRVLTLRLSRYVGAGAGFNSIAESRLDYTASVPSDLRQVGAVRRGGKTYPLYLATVGFDLQKVRDLVARRNSGPQPDSSVAGDFIDFDLCGKTDGVTSVLGDSDSAFNVFGVTLESASVSIDFLQGKDSPGNVFTQDEKERTVTLALRGQVEGAKGRIDWTARNVMTGREFASGTLSYGPLAADETVEKPFDLDFTDEIGVYEVTFDVKDAAGAHEYAISTRTAVVPPAGRLVSKEESAYNTWWFKGPHGCPSAWEIGGALLQKAGIAKSVVGDIPTDVAERYNITYNGSVTAPGPHEFDPATGKFKPHGKLSGEEWFVAEMKKMIATKVRVDHVLVWHERAPAYTIPEEVLDLPVPAATDVDRAAAAYVNEVGRLVRKHFPDLILQVGNSGMSALGAACLPFRGGVDPQYYDYIGMESGMASKFPEVMHVCGIQGLMVAEDCVARYAKRPVKATACFEYIVQASVKLGELRQAQWYMRDALVMLAHDFRLVPLGVFFDSNGAYFDSVWGNAGLLFRSPYVEPKLAYVAYAALTKALDGVKFVKRLDTGSTTVYAVLFRRVDGRYATAFWCAKGEAELELDVSGGGEVSDMLGHESSLGLLGLWGKKVTASESPCYVVTENPVEGVKMLSRTFPSDAAFLAKGAEVARLTDPAQVTVAPDRRAEYRQTRQLPLLRASGHFAVKGADDPEKGRCLEVTLDTSKEKVNPYFTEYTTLRLKEPVVVEKPCKQLGIWVKGNSNWASVCFEIEDAEGEDFTTFYVRKVEWKSLEWGNWPMWVNFDGWSIASCAFERGPWEPAGVVAGGKANGRIDFPIKVRAVTVEMNRRKLDLVDFRPTDTTIRLGPIVTSDEPGLAIPRVPDEYTED